MGRQDDTLTWLTEELGTSLRPAGCSARIVGTYDKITNYVTISMVVECSDTEYRVTRLHRPVNTFKDNNEERLRYLHRNMVSYIIDNYKRAAFGNVVRKFLKWSKNPAHAAVLGRFTSSARSSSNT